MTESTPLSVENGDSTRGDWSDLAVSPVDVADGFFRGGGAWAQRCRELGAGTFFLGPAWLDAWWTVYRRDRRPLVLDVRAGNELIAAMPLWQGTERTLGVAANRIGWLGTGERVCPDHLDPAIHPESSRERIAATVGGHLHEENSHWDVICLLDSRPGGFAAALGKAMADHGYSARTEPCSVCPRIELPPTFEELLYVYSHKRRASIRYYARRLERLGGYRVEWFDRAARDNGEAIEQALTQMTRLHTLARGVHDDAGNFGDPEYRAFHRRLIERTRRDRMLRLAFLYGPDGVDPIAFRYGFLHGDNWLDYQTGYDPGYKQLSIGAYLFGECVMQAIAEGARVFDMLRGDHDYKRHWATGSVNTETVWIFNRNAKGRLLRLAHRTRDRLRSLRDGS